MAGVAIGPAVVGSGTRHLPRPRTHAPVTNPRQGRRTRQLLSGMDGCARGQMSASVSHKYITSSSSDGGFPSARESASFFSDVHLCWWSGTVVGRRSLTGELSLSCARPAADG